ncbi:hypothetical protein EV356DRAFT_113016 [Viridothelium virens]|uniref:DUF8212 domain-containing protein n=1 Tax=Viridothelium virens TaxID=1048519 RepID=A0A6A6HDN5_VIRVR|nr:hypothetical protein EV356DRAFT_113016 [Viridothelium virens]
MTNSSNIKEMQRNQIKFRMENCRSPTGANRFYVVTRVDTFCIDKSSSAELSEAIDSMYLWYEKANKCYTYLEDVPADVNTKSIGSELTRTGWATRGWTLQELLAPPVVMFYSKDWVQIGTKDTLSYVLSRTTGIDEDLLTRKKVLDQASIAKRMFWAGRRNVTRPEDIAYCLMGIFSVNMPMLYGEGGTKAFLRLQEEIMKHSDDHSIFAWTDEEASSDAFHGLLAVHPSRFRLSKSVIPYKDREERVSYSMSNRGVCIELYLTHLPDEGPNIYAAPLDCPVPPRFGDHAFLAIYLQKLPGGQRQYTRVKIGCLAEIRDRGALHTIYVRQAIVIPTLAGVYPSHVLQLRKVTGTFPEYKVVASMVPPAADGAKATLSSKAAYFGFRLPPGNATASKILSRGENRVSYALQIVWSEKEPLLITLPRMGGSPTGNQYNVTSVQLL